MLNLDKSAWKRVAFGDVVRNVNETVRDLEAAGIDRIIAMEHLDPGELKVSRWGSTDAGRTFTRRVKPGQTLFGKRRAYQRKAAYAEFDAICSGDIYTFDADETQLRRDLLPFIVQSEGFFEHALGTSAGSLSPRTNWRDLKDFEFNLPSFEEQTRMADLLWAIERHKRTLADEVESVQGVLARVAATRLSALPTTARLGDLTTTRSGPSFPASDVHGESVEGSVPVIGIPNTKPDGTIDLEGVGHVTGLPASVSTIDESSLILIRTNGNRQRIGNVYIPPEAAHGHAVSAFQFLMRANDMSDRDYLFWVLSEAGMQHRMSDAASGTVGLGNLAVRWLNELEIPWTELPEERRAFVETLGTLRDGLARLRAEVAAVTAVGKVVLGEMLGGS
ncbi:restriction endonuclease subunit S [Brevibacterium pityocampae]|uniref:Restriction endonuclease subunit S n=2 Tax=Brevibacteriaceae TaxID=85019 RepID=A0ABP8JDJ5_9MICO